MQLAMQCYPIIWFVKNRCARIRLVGRYGGEEFVIILPETTSAATCEVAERLRVMISKAFENTSTPRITVSIGVATCQPETPDLEALVQIADVAMYSAKKTGGNRVVFA
jgi:diguanylate cyclase (GGDEF)-like protein